MRVVSTALLALAMSASCASACTCPPFTRAEIWKSNTAVFVGQILAIRDSVVRGRMGRTRVATEIGWVTTFRIETAWKGVAKGQVVNLFVPRLCGYQWSAGQLWVIFAAPERHQPSLLQTTVCSRSEILSPSGEAFLWLQANTRGEREEDGAAGAILTDTSLAFHSTPGIWFMLMRVDCDQPQGMEAEITDPTGKVICPLRGGNSGATAVANRCDCLGASIGPREGSIPGSSFLSAACWQPGTGPYRIRVKGLARCRITVSAGAHYSPTPHWGPTDSLTIEPGEEFTWSVWWGNVAAGDSTRATLRRSTGDAIRPGKSR